MAITITAKLDASGVKSGAAQVGDALEGMADKGVQSTDKLDQVAKELFDQLGDLKGRTEALKVELASMAASGVNSLGRVEDAAEEAGDAIGSIGSLKSNAMGAITAISTGYLALVDIAGKFVEAGAKGVETVRLLAEDGNPAAMELAGAFDEVKKQLFELAESPVFQEAFQDFADLIETRVVPAINSIPLAMFDTVSAVELQAMKLKEFFGQVPEGSTDMLRQMQEMARTGYKIADELAAKNREARKQAAEAAKLESELSKIQNAKDDEALKQTLEQIKTEAELRDIIDDLTESVREEAAERNLSDEERERAITKIRIAEERLKEVRANSAESEKIAAEESVRIASNAASERERIAKEEADRKQQIARDALEQERRNIEERKRLVLGGDVKGAEQLLGSQTREQVREAYARQQSEGASLAATFSGMSEKEVARERQRALATARRQFDNGTANAADIRNAQVELAGQAADSAVAQGNVSKETAQATKEAIAELARTQNELGQVQAEMENMRKIMSGISQGANRRRAQVAGGRQ